MPHPVGYNDAGWRSCQARDCFQTEQLSLVRAYRSH